jgi:voltage-gated sodium channel
MDCAFRAPGKESDKGGGVKPDEIVALRSIIAVLQRTLNTTNENMQSIEQHLSQTSECMRTMEQQFKKRPEDGEATQDKLNDPVLSLEQHLSKIEKQLGDGLQRLEASLSTLVPQTPQRTTDTSQAAEPDLTEKDARDKDSNIALAKEITAQLLQNLPALTKLRASDGDVDALAKDVTHQAKAPPQIPPLVLVNDGKSGDGAKTPLPPMASTASLCQAGTNFEEGTMVKADQTFKTDGDNPVQYEIGRGVHGRIKRINDDGNALMKFDGIAQNCWVTPKCFGFITKEAEATNKAKMSMNPDSDVETEHLVAQEDASLRAVFHTDGPDAIAQLPYKVEDFYYKHGCCQAIARSPMFANLTIFIVAFNAVYLGVDSDYNPASNIYDADWGFLVISQFFCAYFTFEVVVRFLAFEIKSNCWQDGWFKFDMFLVVTMIVDIWVIMLAFKILSGGAQIAIPTQPLRILRLFKITRMARLMKAFPELVVMIKGLFRSLRAIASTGVLVGLMVYTWAILIHMLVGADKDFNKDLKEDFGYEFSYVGDIMWALLMAGTMMLDNAAPLMTRMMYSKDMAKLFAGMAFVSYAFLSALLILQMLIGVLCDVVAHVGQERRDADNIGLVRQEILTQLQHLDQGDGNISRLEMMNVLEGNQAKALLKKLNINRLFLTQIATLMYPDDDAKVPIRTVLELMVMCKGDNQATVEIIASSLCFLSSELAELETSLFQMVDKRLGVNQHAALHKHTHFDPNALKDQVNDKVEGDQAPVHKSISLTDKLKSKVHIGHAPHAPQRESTESSETEAGHP